MRAFDVSGVIAPVAEACVRANRELPADIWAALARAAEAETSPGGRRILATLIENATVARQCGLPICQDTGAIVVFVEIGQELHLVGGDLYEAINAGVGRGCREGYLRASMLANPITRQPNTGDNTPAIVHTRIVPGEGLRLHIAPKGGGAENQSALWMLKPADGPQVIVDAVVRRIKEASGCPCPPLVLGMGIGGTFEKATLMAKEALLRPLGQPSEDPAAAELERVMLEAVNATGVGPAGLGGDTTALAVHVLIYPVHIASMPVALNIQCHAARHLTLDL